MDWMLKVPSEDAASDEKRSVWGGLALEGDSCRQTHRILNAIDVEIVKMGMVTWALEAAWVWERPLCRKPLCPC